MDPILPQVVQARYDYDPYGRRATITGNTESDFGYTGHFYHGGSALHLAMFRALDSGVGRWLSRDPIEEAGGFNLYASVFNDPINAWDPLGLELIFKNYSKKKLGISRDRVLKLVKEQFAKNCQLRYWFNDLLAKKDLEIDDILLGPVNVEVGIYDVGYWSGQGQTRWDGVFSGRWPGQPNQTTGINSSLFEPSWLKTDNQDARRAAELVIHELSHWVEAHSLGRTWPGLPERYIDSGYYVEDLIKW